MIELKPCPFCGGEAKIYGSAFFTCEAKVMCPTCRIQTATYKEPSMDNAIWFAKNAWNKRAEPSRPRGHWEMVSQHETPPTYVYSCSECSHKSFGFYNFCPSCGADMREDGATNADVES